MGTLNLGENIVKMRKEKGVTQEELASFIGVTKASVSKWETGMTTPDIQILPVLASFFDRSVDQLIGYEPQLDKKQIQYYYHKLADDFATKPFEEVIEECEKLIKKYYSCYPFLHHMAILLMNHFDLAGSKELQMEVMMKIVSLCNRVIEESKNITLCDNAIYLKALIDLQSGRIEEVIESLEEERLDENRTGDKGILLAAAYLAKGDVERATLMGHLGMFQNVMDFLSFGIQLLESQGSNIEYCDQIVGRLDAVMEVFDIKHLNPNTDAGYQYKIAMMLCARMAEKDEKLEKQIFQRINNYVDSIILLAKDDMEIHGDSFFYTLDSWLENLSLGTKAVRNYKVVLESAIKALEIPLFQILNQEKLMHCKQRIDAIAKK